MAVERRFIGKEVWIWDGLYDAICHPYDITPGTGIPAVDRFHIIEMDLAAMSIYAELFS